MRRLLWALAAAASLSAQAWTPPPNPDPQTILNEARADRAALRFEDALQKHLWFHNEALGYQPAMSGVRLSFAIGDWGLLATRYEPAMKALRRTRAAAADKVRSGADVANAFAELAAIDAELDEFWATQRDYLALAARDEPQARWVFRSAANALIEVKDFATYARFVDPKAEMDRLLRVHSDIVRNSGHLPGAGEMHERMLAEKAARIISALVLGGRTEDARAAASAARAATAVPATHEAFRRALEGAMPPPFVDPSWKSTFRHFMP